MKKPQKLFANFGKIFSAILFINLFLAVPIVSAQSLLQITTPTPTTDLTPTPTPDCKQLGNCPTSAPTATPTPGSTATPTPGGATPTSTPIPTPKPTVKPTVIFVPTATDAPTDSPTDSPTPQPSNSPTPTPTDKPSVRSAFVSSVNSPDQLPFTGENIVMSAFMAVLIIILIMFPSELFNSTVQSNYDEIIRWKLIRRIRKFYQGVNHLPTLLVVSGFAILGAVINSLLSPDFGFNKSTIALVLGMLLALGVISLVYDVTRSLYMKRRFGQKSKLRAHSLGLVTGAVLVAASRMINFVPGYCYGIFTALVFKENPKDDESGEGLAFASALLIIVALIGWFSWIPIKHAATANNPSFWALIFDSAFASLWVSTLTGTVFGLFPITFMYGETIKNWKSWVWGIIYFTGVFLFVYTILNPAVGIYGTSGTVSWIEVISLFVTFGAFSVGFWAYFRFRPQRKI
ncbi:MAG TPA: PT domain-containing protein [Candidatus Saccharimonadales bacterium]|nr:PT domain-containing protein [Candidatus Saccharimonadales bacterium]